MKKGIVFKREISFDSEDLLGAIYAKAILYGLEEEITKRVIPAFNLTFARYEDTSGFGICKEILYVKFEAGAWMHPDYNAILDYLIERDFTRIA